MTATLAGGPSLAERHLDALREVANIGAGHAATALSQMIGSTVRIGVPRLSVAPLAELPPVVAVRDEPVAAVVLNMVGDATGRTLLVFPRDGAMRLAELMLQRPSGSSHEIGTLEQSAISEAGNILSSAYLNALGAFMGMILLPSPPKFSVDKSAAVIATAHLQFGADADRVVCAQTEMYLSERDETLRAFFLLLPDSASLTTILRAMELR